MNSFINGLVDRHQDTSPKVTPSIRSRFEPTESFGDLPANLFAESDPSTRVEETSSENAEEQAVIHRPKVESAGVDIKEVQLNIERTLEITTPHQNGIISPRTKHQAAKLESPSDRFPKTSDNVSPTIQSVHSTTNSNPTALRTQAAQEQISTSTIRPANLFHSTNRNEQIISSDQYVESITPTVRISIGRIEVKAQQQARPTAPKRKLPTRQQPKLTLEDYLKKRT